MLETLSTQLDSVYHVQVVIETNLSSQRGRAATRPRYSVLGGYREKFPFLLLEARFSASFLAIVAVCLFDTLALIWRTSWVPNEERPNASL
ncbi:Uncharacterised protein [Corynebacterium minutissimum]|uniref:Uncharacterized protein n=1 Tax=Corynebacterium minutissimum TaxID=38301 RepID=A0A2X4RVV7_9CORY|nr:Uncharacterised protein [Corynebacterium minutissimum]VEG05492.1 Uncharacterised protein [Corynebacterium minutissimum]